MALGLGRKILAALTSFSARDSSGPGSACDEQVGIASGGRKLGPAPHPAPASRRRGRGRHRPGAAGVRPIVAARAGRAAGVRFAQRHRARGHPHPGEPLLRSLLRYASRATGCRSSIRAMAGAICSGHRPAFSLHSTSTALPARASAPTTSRTTGDRSTRAGTAAPWTHSSQRTWRPMQSTAR